MALSQPIITVLIAAIKATLADVSSVKEVIAHPFAGSPTKFPAVVFYPVGFDNDFMSTQENFKTYRFKLWLIISTGEYTDEEVFEEILPKAIDELLEKFDNDWDDGTIDGHRAWGLVNTGVFGKGEEEGGATAWVEADLLIKVATNN